MEKPDIYMITFAEASMLMYAAAGKKISELGGTWKKFYHPFGNKRVACGVCASLKRKGWMEFTKYGTRQHSMRVLPEGQHALEQYLATAQVDLELLDNCPVLTKGYGPAIATAGTFSPVPPVERASKRRKAAKESSVVKELQ